MTQVLTSMWLQCISRSRAILTDHTHSGASQAKNKSLIRYNSCLPFDRAHVNLDFQSKQTKEVHYHEELKVLLQAWMDNIPQSITAVFVHDLWNWWYCLHVISRFHTCTLILETGNTYQSRDWELWNDDHIPTYMCELSDICAERTECREYWQGVRAYFGQIPLGFFWEICRKQNKSLS